MKIDIVSITRANGSATSHIKQIREKLEAFDSEKSGINGNCKYCSYINTGRIGGCAITTKPCGVCGEDMTFSNTCTDAICKRCAEKNRLCRHCGGDIELKNRRGKRLIE